MTAFADKCGVRRIGALIGSRFPRFEGPDGSGALDVLRAALDPDVYYLHSVHTDPALVPHGLRHLCGAGIVVPCNPRILENDAAFWREQHTARLRVVLAEVSTTLGASPLRLFHDARFRAAMSYARQLLALQVDVVFGLDINDHAVVAAAAARLIGVPCAIMLRPDVDPRRNDALAWSAKVADVVFCGPHQRPWLEQLGVEAVRLVEPGLAMPGDVSRLRERLVREPELPQGVEPGFVGTPVEPVVMPGEAAPFSILGAERTGSNMLSGLLTNQAKVAVAGELFNPRALAERTIQWIRGVDRDEAALVWLRDRAPVSLLQRLCVDAELSGRQHVGFKFLHMHGLANDRAVRAMLAFPEMPVVELSRVDAVRRWISLRRAQQSDRWYVASGAKSTTEPKAMRVDARELLTGIVLEEQLADRFVAIFGANPIVRLTYEELVSDRGAALQRIGRLLGREFVDVEASSRKQGGKDLADMIENIDEVRSAFEGTRYEPLFATAPGDSPR